LRWLITSEVITEILVGIFFNCASRKSEETIISSILVSALVRETVQKEKIQNNTNEKGFNKNCMVEPQ
jgi:hypothetical protein